MSKCCMSARFTLERTASLLWFPDSSAATFYLDSSCMWLHTWAYETRKRVCTESWHWRERRKTKKRNKTAALGIGNWVISAPNPTLPGPIGPTAFPVLIRLHSVLPPDCRLGKYSAGTKPDRTWGARCLKHQTMRDSTSIIVIFLTT